MTRSQFIATLLCVPVVIKKLKETSVSYISKGGKPFKITFKEDFDTGKILRMYPNQFFDAHPVNSPNYVLNKINHENR